MLAEAWRRLSGLNLAEGRDEAATACDDQEILLLRDLLRENPDDPVMLDRFNNACTRCAWHRHKSGRESTPPPGIERVRDALTEVTRRSPDAPDLRLVVARGWVEWGRLLQESGCLDEADRAFRQAEPIIEHLRRDPSPLTRKTQALLAVEIGRFEDRRGRFPSALAAFQRALVLYEELARDDPGFRQATAMCHHVIGNLHCDLEHWDEAAAAFRRAEAMRAALAAEQPGDRRRREDLEGTRRNLAEVLARGPSG